MKRIVLHILFWICYAAQVMLVEYLWGTATLPQLTQQELLTAAFKTSLIYPIPKIFFCYFVAYYVTEQVIRKKGYLAVHILEILAALFVTIVFDRLLTNYVVLPYAYKGVIPTMPLLEPRRVLIVFLYTGFASGLMIAIKLVRNQLASKEREKNLIKEKLETELKFLRNQVNPHFLFNTLNNIYALTRKKSDKAPEVVMKLSELLSFMLYESGKESITIAEEIKILEDYIDLERIRYNERLSIKFFKDLDNTTQPIAPLLLLPLVENAFKHGVSETRFDSFVHIEMQLKNAQFRFLIENTVPGGKTGSNNSCIGLNNTRRQLELMYKEHQFNVRPQPTSFSVEMIINLNSYGKT